MPGFCASRDQRIRSSCGAVVEKPAAICLAKAVPCSRGGGSSWWRARGTTGGRKVSSLARAVQGGSRIHHHAFSPSFCFSHSNNQPFMKSDKVRWLVSLDQAKSMPWWWIVVVHDGGVMATRLMFLEHAENMRIFRTTYGERTSVRTVS